MSIEKLVTIKAIFEFFYYLHQITPGHSITDKFQSTNTSTTN